MATKTAKNTAKNFDFSKTIKSVKESAKEINDFVLETSEEVIDGTISTAGQWQTVGEKAIKGGLKLVASQQDLVFDTLETLKSQLTQSRSRIKDLFSRN